MTNNSKTKFSVNLNKVALLRNARAHAVPSISDMAVIAINNGCDGITLHPRVDERHAKVSDVKLISELDIIKEKSIEINVEGDLRQEIISLVKECNVHQFTVVPVRSGEITTERGWGVDDDSDLLLATIDDLSHKLRVIVFVEPDEAVVRDVAAIGAHGVEFHTKWYAEAYGTVHQEEALRKLKDVALTARSLGLRINLGHDLNLNNLSTIIQCIKPDEVSIGHALIADSLSYGLGPMIREYTSNMIY